MTKKNAKPPAPKPVPSPKPSAWKGRPTLKPLAWKERTKAEVEAERKRLAFLETGKLSSGRRVGDCKRCGGFSLPIDPRGLCEDCIAKVNATSAGPSSEAEAEYVRERLLDSAWGYGTADDFIHALQAFDGGVYTYANVALIADLAEIFAEMKVKFGEPKDGLR